MDKKRNWKAWMVIGLAILAVLQVLPTFIHDLPEFYTSMFEKELAFGLDLKGGLELQYTVDYKKAIGDNTNRLREGLSDRLVDAKAKKAGKDADTLTDAERAELAKGFVIARPRFNTLTITFNDAADAALLDTDLANSLDIRFELRNDTATTATLFLPDKAIADIKNEIVNQTLSVIRKRVDAFGLVEPDVRRSGESDIDVQLPGLNERQMAVVRERIGQAAQLTFRMVDETTRLIDDQAAALDTYKQAHVEEAKTLRIVQSSPQSFLRSERKSELIGFVKSMPVSDANIVGYEYVEQKDPLSNEIKDRFWRTWVLETKAHLTGENLTKSRVGYSDKNQPVVDLEFDGRGARIFADLTGKSVGKLMAIMLDDEVASAPRINERIGGGRAQITMGGGRSAIQIMEDARSLVTVLNNGAYKAAVIKVHDVEVGPSLGHDAVQSGMISIVIGFLLVVVFMVVYYRKSGLIADIALFFNLVLMLACLVSFNAALTLPGMAGLVLTVGMAVDANVLIFERIREEMRNGRSPRNALDLGYGKAFWSIFDSQLTTAIAAFVLMQYASGPIYGFAVTLLIGIGCSMFTAIIVTRMIFNYLIDTGRLEQISI